VVVSSNLMPWLISVHMVLALVILAISIYTYFKVRSARDKDLLVNRSSTSVKWLAVVSMVLLMYQVVVGTEVREYLDQVSSSTPAVDRSEWISMLGGILLQHRIIAYISATIALLLFVLIRSRFASGTYQSFYSN